jgi:putative inorganic carbon (hco3(-)) transporter
MSQAHASVGVRSDLFFRKRSEPLPGSFVALAVFVFLLYANLAMWIPFLDFVRPAQLSIAVAMVLLFVENSTARSNLKLVRPEGPLIIGFLFVSILSISTALWPRMALESTVDLAKCTAVYFLVSQTVDRIGRVKALLWTMVLGGLFPAIGTLYFYASGVTTQGRAAWLGIFGNPNDVAYALVLLVPLALALGTLAGPRGRLLSGAVLLIYLAALYTTFSRGGLIGFLAVVCALGMRVRSSALRLVGVALLGTTVLAATYFWNREEGGFAELGSDFTVNQRIVTVKAGLLMLVDHPLLGVGLGCSIVGFDRYVEAGELTRTSLVVHNTFIQALAETGLLGGLLYLILIFGAIASAHRIASGPGESEEAQERRIVGAALFASLVGFAVCGLSSGEVLSWFPFILLGLLSACRRLPTDEGASARWEAA